MAIEFISKPENGVIIDDVLVQTTKIGIFYLDSSLNSYVFQSQSGKLEVLHEHNKDRAKSCLIKKLES